MLSPGLPALPREGPLYQRQDHLSSVQVRLDSSAAVSIVSVIPYFTSRTREVHQLTDLSSLERVSYSSATSEDVRCNCCNGDHLAVRFCSDCKELICLTKVKVNYEPFIDVLNHLTQVYVLYFDILSFIAS